MVNKPKSGDRRRGAKPSRVIDLEANDTAPEEGSGKTEISKDTKTAGATKAGPDNPKSEKPPAGTADKASDAKPGVDAGKSDKDAAPTPSSSSPPNQARQKSGTSFGAMLVSAVLGGGVALGGASLIGENSALKDVPVIGGLFAGDGQNAALVGEVSQLREQIAEIRDTTTPPDPALGDKVAALEEELIAIREAAVSGETGSSQEAIAAASAASEKAASLESRIDELSQRIIESAGGDPVDMEAVKAALSEDLTRLNGRLDNLETELADVSGTDTSETLSGIQVELAALSEQVSGLSNNLNSLDERVGGIETSVSENIIPSMESVEKAAVAAVESQKVARSVSARSLGAVLENGGSFASELASAEALLGNNDTIDGLRDLAQSGIRSRAGLAADFDPVADRIIALQGQDRSEMSIVERFMSSAQNLVKVRPAGPVEGDDDVAVVSRIDAALEAGDISAALAEYEKLSEAAKNASSDWREKAQAYLEAEGLINQLIGRLSNPDGASENGQG